MKDHTWITIIALASLSMLGSSEAQNLIYDFEDGTSQGWTTISSDSELPHAFTQTNEASENGSTFPVPDSGDYQMLPIVFEAEDGTNVRDNAHQSLIIRSPEFVLGEGELSVSIVGGDAHGALPEAPADLATSTDAEEGIKAQGFGVRRVSDNTYVVTGARSTNDDIYQAVIVSAEDLAPFISETETYTVDVFDSSAGGWGWIGFDNVKIPGRLPASNLVFDFEDGTSQGWTTVSSDDTLPHAFTQTNEPSENGTTFPVPASGDYQMLPIVFEAEDGTNFRDNAHQSLIIRSPEFILGGGELSVSIVGGDAHGALPETPAEIATATDAAEGVKAQGFGVRRVSDDTYVATGARSTNDDIYQDVIISAEDLAPFVSDSETYTVDVFDSSAGGWGWIGFDNVKIPGKLPPSKLVFDFEDGTSQGWTTVSSDDTLPHAFTQTNEPSENGSTFPVPASGDYQMLPIVFEAEDGTNVRDNAHQSLIIRSPEFMLSEGELSVAIVGGDAHGALPEAPAELATSTDAEEGVKAQGFGVRRVSDDTYVATGARSTNDDIYQDVIISAEDLAPFVSDSETYTVDVFDSSAGGWGWIGFDNVVVPGTLATPAELIFDFEGGDAQGWTNVSFDAELPHAFTPVADPSENGETFPTPASGDSQMLPIVFEAEDGTNVRDNAHQTLITRSPEFYLADGDLAISIVGGDAHGSLPSSPADLATSTDAEEGAKAQGFGLRRVSDDTYVATGARSTNDDIYQEVIIPAAELASFVSSTEAYTVDVFDSSSGGWGWIGFDNVKVSGRLVNPIVDPGNPDFDDVDNDGMDDKWETTHELDLTKNDSAEDPDDDGLTNIEEFQLRTFPKVADTDSDGLKDSVETKTGTYVDENDTGTHPLRPDTDFDGLLDGVENPNIAYDSSNPATTPGTSPNNGDSDGDGGVDGLEISAGTNPTEAGPLPSNIVGNGTFKTVHVWTDSNLEIFDSFDAEEALEDPDQPGFRSIEADTPNVHFHDTAEPPIHISSSRPYPLWDNDTDGFGARDNFAIRSEGEFELAHGGLITFVVSNAGGFMISVDGDIEGEGTSGGRDVSIIELELAAGIHDLEFLHWDSTGDSGVSLFIYRGLDEVPDFAFTAQREPETNPLEPYWEVLRAFGGDAGTFSITDITRSASGEVSLTWGSDPGQFFEIETSFDLTSDSWTTLMAEIPAAADDALATTILANTNLDSALAHYRVVRVPPPPLFQDDFEDGLGDWTVSSDGIETTTSWEVGVPADPPGPFAGANVAGTDLDANFVDGILSDAGVGITLRSPVIDLSGLGRATLTFQHSLDLPNPQAAGGRLNFLRADDLSLILDRGQEEYTFAEPTEAWQQARVRLSPEIIGAGNVIIEWEFLTAPDENPDDNGAGWFIDDVTVD